VTISELGNLGEFLAAIATIVTLAYLALQIRQSNQSNQLTAVARFGESTEFWLSQIIKDPTLLDVYSRGLRDAPSFSREEQFRFNLLVVQFLRGVESGWLQVELGLVDPEYWAGFRESIRVIVGSEAGRRAFDGNRTFFAPRFAAEVDQIIGTP
jgi:hypothetical protein